MWRMRTAHLKSPVRLARSSPCIKKHVTSRMWVYKTQEVAGSATWHAWDRDFQFWLSESKNNRILEVNFLFTPPISIISVHSSYHPNSLRTRRPRKAPRKAKVDVLCNYILRRWQTKKKCLNAFMGHANTKLRFRDTWTCELCVAWPATKFNGLYST